jgi:hypothetical protein
VYAHHPVSIRVMLVFFSLSSFLFSENMYGIYTHSDSLRRVSLTLTELIVCRFRLHSQSSQCPTNLQVLRPFPKKSMPCIVASFGAKFLNLHVKEQQVPHKSHQGRRRTYFLICGADMILVGACRAKRLTSLSLPSFFARRG